MVLHDSSSVPEAEIIYASCLVAAFDIYGVLLLHGLTKMSFCSTAKIPASNA